MLLHAIWGKQITVFKTESYTDSEIVYNKIVENWRIDHEHANGSPIFWMELVSISIAVCLFFFLLAVDSFLFCRNPTDHITDLYYWWLERSANSRERESERGTPKSMWFLSNKSAAQCSHIIQFIIKNELGLLIVGTCLQIILRQFWDGHR